MNKEKFNKSKIHYPGKFIVVDGGEGSGKTTVIKSLFELLSGKKILITHEPGGSPLAEQVRALILSDEGRSASAETHFALNWAYRHNHLQKIIEPALKKGITVISDRFDSSTYAYQIFAQKAPYLKKLFWEIRKIYLRETKPDIYIFFDVDPKIGLVRATNRKGEHTHFDNRKIDFHRNVRKGFKEFFKHVPHEIIDANKSLEEVKSDFVSIIKKII